MNREHQLERIVDILNSKKYYVLNFKYFNYDKYSTIKRIMPFINKTTESEKVLEIEGMTSLHINFKESYKFESLPKNFNYMAKIKELSKILYLYKNNPFELRNVQDVLNEMDNNLEILKEWAENLPERKEK